MECKNTALCIFDKQPTQTDIIKSYVSDYFPITSISAGGPIEFHIPGNTEDYVDVNDIFLYLKIKIVKATGAAIDAADKVGLVNLPICSLFQDVSLTLGETQIEGGQQNYPYVSYLDTVMQFHPAAQKSHMQIMGWEKDEAGKFDDETNTGFVKRQAWTAGSKVCELYGPLYLDFTRQSRFLISQTDMRIRFLPAKAEFALNAFGAAGDFKIKFEAVSLHVRRMLLNPSVISGHAAGMNKHNAIYPVNHTELITFTIPRGQKSHVKDRLFPLQAPKLLIVGMVENDAYNGMYKKNPFHFQHFDMSKIALYREGESIPGRPFTPDFDNDHYSRSYANTMQTFHYLNTDDTNGLTYNEFGKGYTLYAYDLTADNDIAAAYRQTIPHSNLRLELYFKKDLANTINVLLFAVFDSHVEITKLRDVLTNYTR